MNAIRTIAAADAGRPTPATPAAAPSAPAARQPSAAAVWVPILQAVAAVLLFSVSDAMAKLLRVSLPAIEVAWLRYVTFAAFAVVVSARGGVAGAWPKRPGMQVLRGVVLLGSAVFFITGLSHLQMAEASAISFVSPAFITALSIPFLGEVVGVRRWMAVLAGLVGVLIVIRPGGGALQAAAMFPLLSAMCWAVTIIVTRRMGTADRTETTLLWSAVVGLVLLTALLPFGFVAPSLAQAGIGVLIGLAASTGQYLLILAYRRAAASLLAPFSYAQLLSSTLLGYLVFGAVPDGLTFLGAGVIIASGLYTVHRERVRARASVAAQAP